MFGFHLGTIHVSKNETYDDNNNVIRSIYQVLVLGDFGLESRVNVGRFRIVVENFPKSFQNIVLTPKNCSIYCKCHPASYGDQARGCPKTSQSLIFVHRLVWFFQWGWNAFNLSLPIDLFSTHESLCSVFAFCSVKMIVVIFFFLTNVEMKRLGLASLFTTFKEVVLLLVHHFAKIVIVPSSMLICV